MPAADISTAQMGTPVPLSYGQFRATGMQLISSFVPSTSESTPNMQIGFWDLGEGEIDSCVALWINDQLMFALDRVGTPMGSSLVGVTPTDTATTATLNFFSFHTGCDAPLGASPGYSATNQWLDPMWQYIAAFVQPLCYSRRAYYVIGWTPPTSGGSSSFTPVADFLGMRCRIFDYYGNQVGYQWTDNPIWHAVDLWIRLVVKPEYAIPQGQPPTQLTAEESSRFNWQSIAYAAAGVPNAAGNYVFKAGSTLQAMLEQIFLCCRGYQYEYAGQIYMFIDKPRTSTFVVSAHHLAPGAIEFDNTQVNQNANRYIAQFLEVDMPAVATINTIDRTSSQVNILTTTTNPCAVGDIIGVGGVTQSTFDAFYLISEMSDTLGIVCDLAGGEPYDSTGGSIGYLQSRFTQRNPEIQHVQHQLAQGTLFPPNVTGTRLKRIRVTYDFGTTSYDQAMRMLQYECYRDLGLDQVPYKPPIGLTLSLFAEATDSGGAGGSLRALKAQLQGDVITLDESVLFELAGDYEIMERYISPIQQEIEDSTDGNFVQPTSRTGMLTNGTDSNSGVLKLVLRTFNGSPIIFTDTAPAPTATYATVPYVVYAGDGVGGTPGGISTSTLTVTTPYDGGVFAPGAVISSVEWTEITVVYGSGLTLEYAASGAGPLVSGGAQYYLYIDDPSYSGASSCVVCSSSPSPGGAGVISLVSFTTPNQPVGPPPTYSPNVVTITF